MTPDRLTPVLARRPSGHLSGIVVGDDGFITFEPLMTTMMAGEPDATMVATAVTSMLDGRMAFGWTGEDGLSLAKDGTSLVFTAS